MAKSLVINSGSVGVLLKALAEMDEAKVDGGDAQAILDYVGSPSSAIFTVAIDDSVASLALHENFIEVLSANGLMEFFT